MRWMVAAVLLVGCVTSSTSEDTAQAPLVGIDGSHDQADHGCHVVLRDLARAGNGLGGYATSGSSWIWSGTVELSTETAAAGLVPTVMYQSGSDPAWHEATAVASGQAATVGFARFTISIDQGLPGPGMSGTSLANSKIQVVPFVRLPEGGRLFDHNRHPGDLDNYVMNAGDGLAIASDGSVCAPPAGPQRARLVFAADFTQRREGVIVPGGQVAIAYDVARLSGCAQTQGGTPRWDLTAHVRFAPGGQQVDVSVRDGAPTVSVPSDARQAALWFEATSVSGCHQWDSNFGTNYVFDAATAPAWVGDVVDLITRDSSDPCAGGGAATTSFRFDTWARQRAAVSNLCFAVYQPGLTDRDDQYATLWQQLDVSVHWRGDGGAWQVTPIAVDRRIGNNARYALSWRAIDPFGPYHCPTVATTITADGQYVQARLEYYVVVNGAEVRPAPGAAFVGVFEDYAHDPYRDASCH
jgi:hypothetical protein